MLQREMIEEKVLDFAEEFKWCFDRGGLGNIKFVFLPLINPFKISKLPTPRRNVEVIWVWAGVLHREMIQEKVSDFDEEFKWCSCFPCIWEIPSSEHTVTRGPGQFNLS